MSLIAWLQERWENCLRISKTKEGDDRQGWLEDAAYFLKAREAARQLAECSGDAAANSPLRTYIALKILRAWSEGWVQGEPGFDRKVLTVIGEWMDSGMRGPVPWPKGAGFERWAEKNGLSRVGNFVGFRFDVQFREGQR